MHVKTRTSMQALRENTCEPARSPLTSILNGKPEGVTFLMGDPARRHHRFAVGRGAMSIDWSLSLRRVCISRGGSTVSRHRSA